MYRYFVAVTLAADQEGTRSSGLALLLPPLRPPVTVDHQPGTTRRDHETKHTNAEWITGVDEEST